MVWNGRAISMPVVTLSPPHPPLDHILILSLLPNPTPLTPLTSPAKDAPSILLPLPAPPLPS